MDPRPIGIFDSGLGGLTAVKALAELLPAENLIYFGDSANAPYGTRPREELVGLAKANARFLSGFDCKAILVACGTVSSNAMESLRAAFPETPFFGVIEAPCRRAAALTKTKRVAVIATEATVRSGAFARELSSQDGDIQVFSDACQSLVPLAEQGCFGGGAPARKAVEAELAGVKRWGPDVLLLACTHFPLFESEISAFLGPEVRLLSVGAEAALALRDYLVENGLLASRSAGECRWFTSGNPADFSAMGARFLGRPVTAEQHINSEI